MDLHKNRFLFLLIALAMYLMGSSFLVDRPILSYLVGVFFTFVLIASLYVMEHERHFLLVSVTLIILALVGHWILISEPEISRWFQFTVYTISVIFFFIITFSVLRYVVHHERVTLNTLYGAVCGYLLIGLTWSFIYRAMFAISPHSFSSAALVGLTPEDLGQHFTYYSFVTLTTLGYGDLVPLSNATKMFSWVEAVVGQIYLTIWIAQLVGLHLLAKTRKDHEK